METVYKVLANVGCQVKSKKSLELLKDAGCKVDGERVYIPKEIMLDAINSAPKQIHIFDRDGEEALCLDKEHVYFGPPISTVFVKDPYTGEKRKGLRKDAFNAGLICEALDNCNWASAMSGISDGVNDLSDVYEVYELLQSTKKPIMYWASSLENLKIEFEMFEAVAGGKENLENKSAQICLVCPMDPLVHNDDNLEQLIYLAQRGGCAVYISGVTMGCTSPITVAGNLVVGIADTLVGLLISQLAKKGSKFIVSKFGNTMDLRTMTIEDGHPEQILSHMACADIFHWLELPFCSNLGDTDSGIFDQVAAFNGSMSLSIATMSGITMAMGMGGYEKCMMTDYVGTVYGSEVVDYLKHIICGVELTDEALAYDEIEEVGPGGDFMMSDSTFEYCRKLWKPDILSPCTLEEYENKKKYEIEEKYKERIREILDRGVLYPLDEDRKNALDAIIKRAENK